VTAFLNSQNIIKMKKYILIIISTLVLCSCSQEFDREQAHNIITKANIYPSVEVADFSLLRLGSNKYRDLYDLYMLKQPTWGMLQVTDLGKKYLREKVNCYGCKEFATNLLRFGEITGITFSNEEKTQATVEYYCFRTDITPFGRFNNVKEEDSLGYTIEMRKYDDGWRVEQKEGMLKPSEFSEAPEFMNYTPLTHQEYKTQRASVSERFVGDWGFIHHLNQDGTVSENFSENDLRFDWDGSDNVRIRVLDDGVVQGYTTHENAKIRMDGLLAFENMNHMIVRNYFRMNETGDTIKVYDFNNGFKNYSEFVKR